MYKARICLSAAGVRDIEVGPTDSRDEASRLARAWLDAHAGAIAVDASRPSTSKIGVVLAVRVYRTDEEE